MEGWSERTTLTAFGVWGKKKKQPKPTNHIILRMMKLTSLLHLFFPPPLIFHLHKERSKKKSKNILF